MDGELKRADQLVQYRYFGQFRTLDIKILHKNNALSFTDDIS